VSLLEGCNNFDVSFMLSPRLSELHFPLRLFLMFTGGGCPGMMRHEDETLHYYVDGIDQGAACDGVPLHVYAVVDLYGQCAQVSIIQPDRGRENAVLAVGAVSENSSQPLSLQHYQQGNTNSHPSSETTHRYNIIL
jgi:hypothetical protein